MSVVLFQLLTGHRTLPLFFIYLHNAYFLYLVIIFANHVGKENVGSTGNRLLIQEDSMIIKIVKENDARPEN